MALPRNHTRERKMVWELEWALICPHGLYTEPGIFSQLARQLLQFAADRSVGEGYTAGAG